VDKPSELYQIQEPAAPAQRETLHWRYVLRRAKKTGV
jgi:hypothetical protein